MSKYCLVFYFLFEGLYFQFEVLCFICNFKMVFSVFYLQFEGVLASAPALAYAGSNRLQWLLIAESVLLGLGVNNKIYKNATCVTW